MSSGASQTREDFTPDSRDPEAQADGFAHVRNAHESEMAEDYVELIAELIEAHGEARPVDIAERLGVKAPTVTKNISRLKAGGVGASRKVSLDFPDRQRPSPRRGVQKAPQDRGRVSAKPRN